MKEILLDIRVKLQGKHYINEEHVRLSLVARILLALDWNIWDPDEVCTEFAPARTEDNTKVDIALLLRPRVPSVFIEVKADGQMMGRLPDIERQVRDYNRNNTAPFAIITDGRNWRFYFTLTSGEFSQKCFAAFHLVNDDIDNIERQLLTFLKKSAIVSSDARAEAEKYLHLTQKQRTMEDCLPEARRMVQEPPYPRMPEALLELLADKGFEATMSEVMEFIQNLGDRMPTVPKPTPTTRPKETEKVPQSVQSLGRKLNPENPDNLYHTKIIDGHFGGKNVRNWKDLIHTAILVATQKGIVFSELQRFGNLKQGNPQDKSFSQVEGTDLWVQGMDANQCWKKSLQLAKKLGVEVSVHFSWSSKPSALHPGEKAVLEWSAGR